MAAVADIVDSAIGSEHERESDRRVGIVHNEEDVAG
jgi:hypothetical protein